MNGTRFDSITRVFASRRISRRQALAQGGAGIAAGTLSVAGLPRRPWRRMQPRRSLTTARPCSSSRPSNRAALFQKKAKRVGTS